MLYCQLELDIQRVANKGITYKKKRSVHPEKMKKLCKNNKIKIINYILSHCWITKQITKKKDNLNKQTKNKNKLILN